MRGEREGREERKEIEGLPSFLFQTQSIISFRRDWRVREGKGRKGHFNLFYLLF